jgi:hypothetical protein
VETTRDVGHYSNNNNNPWCYSSDEPGSAVPSAKKVQSRVAQLV